MATPRRETDLFGDEGVRTDERCFLRRQGPASEMRFGRGLPFSGPRMTLVRTEPLSTQYGWRVVQF